MIFAGNDHWSPKSHIKDLQDLQLKGVIPSNISISYQPELKHDYVSDPDQAAAVVDFCVEKIQKVGRSSALSRL